MRSVTIALVGLIIVCACRESPRAAPAPAADAGAAFGVAELVDLIAARRLWPIELDVVERRLAALGPWTREQPMPEMLAFKSSCGVVTAEVVFMRYEGRPWSFYGASFDVNEPFTVFAKRLEAKLGKPSWVRKAAAPDARAAGWNLGRGLTLSADGGMARGRTAVHISEPQGEGE